MGVRLKSFILLLSLSPYSYELRVAGHEIVRGGHEIAGVQIWRGGICLINLKKKFMCAIGIWGMLVAIDGLCRFYKFKFDTLNQINAL